MSHEETPEPKLTPEQEAQILAIQDETLNPTPEENFWDDRTTPGAYSRSDSEQETAEAEMCDDVLEDLASNAGQREAGCEACGEIHDEEKFGLNELQDSIFKFLEGVGLGDAAEDLKRAAADQREHRDRMGRVTEQLVSSVEQANSRLEADDEQVDWALFRLTCGCLVPTVRVGDEWTFTSERFAEIARSEQVRQIVEALALLGEDLLGVMRQLQAEGR
jgi:hypothetical protein